MTRQGQGSETILFVDDEAAIIDYGQEILEHLGYRVTTASSGGEGLELFLARPESYSLVITDQNMPGLTGTGLAREIRRLKPDLPIILMTGLETSEVRKAGNYITRYLIKPIPLDLMARAIREELDGCGLKG